MESNLTAVEWLAEQMMHPSIHNPYIEQAKEMEKQEITKAFDAGFKDNSHYQNPNYRDSEQYYNETFNK
jgi:hypothetical protein